MGSRLAVSRIAAVALVGVMSAACGATGEPPRPEAGAGETTSATPALPLVGDWGRTGSCPALVHALDRAGLADVAPDALVRARFFPRSEEIDLAHPCRGAIAEPFDLFFTPDGRFGVIDNDGTLTESESYEPIGEHAFAIRAHVDLARDSVTVRYWIDAGSIRFEVVVPPTCREACRTVRSWAFAFLYPGRLRRIG